MSSVLQISMNGAREKQIFNIMKNRPEIPQNFSDAAKFLFFEMMDKVCPVEE